MIREIICLGTTESNAANTQGISSNWFQLAMNMHKIQVSLNQTQSHDLSLLEIRRKRVRNISSCKQVSTSRKMKFCTRKMKNTKAFLRISCSRPPFLKIRSEAPMLRAMQKFLRNSEIHTRHSRMFPGRTLEL